MSRSIHHHLAHQQDIGNTNKKFIESNYYYLRHLCQHLLLILIFESWKQYDSRLLITKQLQYFSFLENTVQGGILPTM